MRDDVKDLMYKKVPGPDYGFSKKTFISYMIGILLSILLTIVPFAVVYRDMFGHTMTFAVIMISALLQLFVQCVFFLRLNLNTTQGKSNVMTFLFAIFILIIFVFASLWIMYHLDYNMMH